MAPVFSRSRRIGLTLTALAALVALVMLLRGHGIVQKTAPPPAPQITVIKAARRELRETLIVAGTLVPRDEVRITAQVEGLAVLRFAADEGDMVKEGQVLAALDDVSLKAQLAQNTANLARAEAAEQEARKNLARTISLRGKGFATVEQLDQRTSAARVAAADVAAMKAQRDELQSRLSRTEIRAPVAGRVAKRMARLGVIASASEPLFILIADDKVELQADIADTQHRSVKESQTAKVFVPGSEEAFNATVRLVSPQIDPATRLGQIRISLDSQRRLPVGGFARAEIETAKHAALAVPLSALAYDRGRVTVQKVKEGKVATQSVKPGIIADGYAEIVEGLGEGDTVVARAGTFLRDGDLIRPVMAAE